MKIYRVIGCYTWTQEFQECVDISVDAESPEDAIEQVGEDEFGIVKTSVDQNSSEFVGTAEEWPED